MWGILHHAYAKDALLQTLVIFIAVIKWILIYYKGTDCFAAETIPCQLHIHIQHPVHTHNCKNLSELKVTHYCPFFLLTALLWKQWLQTHTSMLYLHIYCLSVSYLLYYILVFFFLIFHCTHTYNNCAWLSNCFIILWIFHNSTCGNSAWYVYTILHVALCVCVCVCVCVRIVLYQDTQLTLSVQYMDWDNTAQYIQHTFPVCS